MSRQDLACHAVPRNLELPMPESMYNEPSPGVRLPNFTEIGDLNALSVIVQDLSIIYDITTVAALPGYSNVILPGTRLGPRRNSPLRPDDRLKIQKVSLASPLVIVFEIASIATLLGVVATNVSRIETAILGYFNVISAGTDHQQRVQALEENKALAPERLREAQLRNAILEQQLRRITAEADLLERARAEVRDPALRSFNLPQRKITGRKRVDEATSADVADLLEEPVQRLLGYAGGEIEITGDYNTGYENY
jgi:hypothetical protein